MSLIKQYHLFQITSEKKQENSNVGIWRRNLSIVSFINTLPQLNFTIEVTEPFWRFRRFERFIHILLYRLYRCALEMKLLSMWKIDFQGKAPQYIGMDSYKREHLTWTACLLLINVQYRLEIPLDIVLKLLIQELIFGIRTQVMSVKLWCLTPSFRFRSFVKKIAHLLPNG